MATKKCSFCKEEKTLDSFFTRKISKDGLRGQCKECDKRYQSNWYDSGKWRNAAYKKKFSITEQDVINLLASQNNSCAICKKLLTYPHQWTHVDHDHTTNKVRGILCGTCNVGLGKLGDSIETLQNAINYLKGNSNGDS